ncbi:MAG TPA: c-type cytochrome [Verrucomicrobiae bacterium]|jgi:mono/diheme cytochrome c family protein
MRLLVRLNFILATWALALGAAHAQNPGKLPDLLARATDGERKVVFTAPTANFTLGSSESVHPQLKPAFEVEWSGSLTILRGGKYTFHANAKVLVDGAEVQGKTVSLETGERALKVEFKRAPGPARLQLEWESDFFRREPVPSSVFSHSETPAELAATTKLERGRQLVEELNCVGCHTATGDLLRGSSGPDLSAVGDRASAAWIFHWLENPQHFRKDALMPALLADAQARADVAAYLASLKPSPAGGAVGTSAAAVAQGKELFNSVGCSACHGDASASLAGLGSKFSPVALARYLADPLAVDPSGRMPEMGLNVLESEHLAAFLVQSKNAEFEKAPPTGDAARGRQLVASSGCANCHTVKDAKGALASTLPAPAWAKLTPGKGCLQEAPPPGAPRFALSAADRECLDAFLKRPDISPAPVQDFHRTISRFQCNACHELNFPARVTFPVSPPPLTDAGNKLRANWLELVLEKRKRVRPWMALRMPHYGEAATAGVVNQFAAQAGAELGAGETIPTPTPEQIQAGIKLIGTGDGGLGCITCHDWKGEKSIGELRGPDLTEMYARVRSDWMRRWLREPSRVIAGTAMPAFFTEMPATKATQMIEDLVRALWAGKDMPTPSGIGEAPPSYTLKVGNEPVLFRTYLPNSHPRSIAVGLPGGQAFCFDAAFCRLRYAWSGGFLDMKQVWATRSAEMAVPLGGVWYAAADTTPLRIGKPDAEAKPKFRGYKLVKKVPVFLYDLDGAQVSEKVTATPDSKGLVREFEVTGAKGDVWFVSGEGSRVRFSSSSGAFANGRLKAGSGVSVKFQVTVVPQ